MIRCSTVVTPNILRASLSAVTHLRVAPSALTTPFVLQLLQFPKLPQVSKAPRCFTASPPKAVGKLIELQWNGEPVAQFVYFQQSLLQIFDVSSKISKCLRQSGERARLGQTGAQQNQRSAANVFLSPRDYGSSLAREIRIGL